MKRDVPTQPLLPRLRASLSLPGLFAAISIFLGLASAASAGTFTVNGTTLQLTLAPNETCNIDADSTSTNYYFVLSGGTWSGTDGNGASGNSLTMLDATVASFTNVTINDSGPGAKIVMDQTSTSVYHSNFTITFSDPGAGEIDLAGSSTTTGRTDFFASFSLYVSTTRNIVVGANCVLSTVAGNLTLLANQQATPTAGYFTGISFGNGSLVESVNVGAITVKGRGGDTGSNCLGVYNGGTLSGGSAGTLTVQGQGGSATSGSNDGVVNDGTITAFGANVVITGTGGAGDDSDGVYSGGSIVANDASNITVTGTGGGGSAGMFCDGVHIQGPITAPGSDTITITGTGGPGNGAGNDGVEVEASSSASTAQTIQSGTGNITLTGTAGGSASLGLNLNSAATAPASIITTAPGVITLIGDSMDLASTASISGPTVNLLTQTADWSIDLGSTVDTASYTLALSGDELATITATTLNIGSATTGSINVSAPITLPAGETTTLTAASITMTGGAISGPTVTQNLTGQPFITVEQPAGTPVLDGASVSFGTVPLLAQADLAFTIRNTGSASLTGLGITFDGVSPGDFSITSSPTTPLPTGSSTTFNVHFIANNGAYYRQATLHLASNAPGFLGTYDIHLSAIVPSDTPISGTRKVGPTGFYQSLTQALADIQGATLGGPLVLELQSTYDCSFETFPLNFTHLSTSATNTLTVRPEAGATGLIITSTDTTAATVNLDGTQYLEIDGRSGGTGTGKQLTLGNTNQGGTVRLADDASHNLLHYLIVLGGYYATSKGNIFFDNALTTGNDNNTIDSCDIGDYGNYRTVNGIYSASSSVPSSGNTVSNCNIYNFDGLAGTVCGIRLDGGNTGWTITGNSFYQTTSYERVGSSIPICLNDPNGGNFTVTGNYIGGSAPQREGSWATTLAYVGTFAGIQINVGASQPSSIQGNIVESIAWNTTSAATTAGGAWCGIYVQAGSANIGTLTRNTIGASTGTGYIYVNGTGGGTTYGIYSSSSDVVNVANNIIGAITTNGTNVNVCSSITGIAVTAGTSTIFNNLIGNPATPFPLTGNLNSLNAYNSAAPTSGSGFQNVTGISVSSLQGATVTGNTIANLNNNYLGTAAGGQVCGIVTGNVGSYTITGNSIRNLSTTSACISPSFNAAALGISTSASSFGGQTVSQNVISFLNATSSKAVSAIGIIFTSSTSGTNLLSGNFVHTLAVSSTFTASSIVGLQLNNGSFIAENNMVRLGLLGTGINTGSAATITGIWDASPGGNRYYYNNSVYIGGTETVGSNSTAAFKSPGNDTAGQLFNNILSNARTSSSGAAGKHYAVIYTTGPITVVADHNIYNASILGQLNLTDVNNLATWQMFSNGHDQASFIADPQFVNPTGTASAVDLHVQPTSPANNAGTPLAAVTDDFDGNPRDPNTPDIGADEIDPTIQVEEPSGNALLSGVSSVTFGSIYWGNADAVGFTVRNLGSVPLSGLTCTIDGANASDFSPTPTSSSPLADGASLTVTVTFRPGAVGARSATLHIASNDPTYPSFDVALTGTGLAAPAVFQQWAANHGVSPQITSVGPNGLQNLLNFGFSIDPASTTLRPLVYTGTFAGNGVITATGQPITVSEGTDIRALFVRRSDYATAGLTYTVVFSSDLTGWFYASGTFTVLADDGTNQIVSVPYPANMLSGGFFQVWVSM